jgi:hypothetical protein
MAHEVATIPPEIVVSFWNTCGRRCGLGPLKNKRFRPWRWGKWPSTFECENGNCGGTGQLVRAATRVVSAVWRGLLLQPLARDYLGSVKVVPVMTAAMAVVSVASAMVQVVESVAEAT